MIALIDYGAGNLYSVANALRAAGARDLTITADPDVVRAADRIVLPGVGAFAACMGGLAAIPGIINDIRSTTPAEVQALAAKYLVPSKDWSMAVVPEKK